MPARRRLLRRDPRIRLAPEAVKLFRVIEEIRDSGNEERWEDEGGRRRESLDAEKSLRRLLGLGWPAILPTDAELARGLPRPDYMRYLCAGETWDRAADLRRQLLMAAGAERAADGAALAKVLRRSGATARRRAKPPRNPQVGEVSAPEGELPENETS